MTVDENARQLGCIFPPPSPMQGLYARSALTYYPYFFFFFAQDCLLSVYIASVNLKRVIRNIIGQKRISVSYQLGSNSEKDRVFRPRFCSLLAPL